jgi:hypothetical protein
VNVRLGLGLSSNGVRAVVVRDGRVQWAAELSLDGRTIGTTVSEVIAGAPLGRWPRPRVVAAVGPAHAQLRRLEGLPLITGNAALARVVAESAGRFFLRNGVPLITTGVRKDGTPNGEGWAAAIEKPVVSALESACRARGLRLAAVLPTMCVLPLALRGDTHTWLDGDVRAQLIMNGNTIGVIRRRIEGTECNAAAVSPEPIPALGSLGTDGWRFADAYGAAAASIRDPLAYRPTRVASAAPVLRWRLAVAAVVCAAGVAAALLAPALVARRTAARASAALAALARQRDAAATAQADLARVSDALGEVAAFDRDRRSATLLVRDLARALPTGAALVALRTDSAGGTLVALAPRAALLLGRLERVSAITTPTFVGPVTREVAGSTEVDRVTIRYRWAAPSAVPATAARRR